MDIQNFKGEKLKQKVILITNTFPYSPGEEFLETELKYWGENDDVQLTIMPKSKTENLRKISKNISVNRTLSEQEHLKKNSLKAFAKILMSPIFYKEIMNNRIYKLSQLKHTLVACRDYLFYKETLRGYIHQQEDQKLIFYSYWHTEVCYALQSLKSEFKQIRIISRIHGYDLYQERRQQKYMPLKKQFVNNLDKLYAISDKGREYAIQTYGFNQDIVKVSRLGVEDRNIKTPPSKEKMLHLVSCSYMTQVKQIDKIIDALSKHATQTLETTYLWTHIGDGALYNILYQTARNKLQKLPNVNFDFKGHLNNKDVYKFYATNHIDCFINVSESEGLPVTIMEAMSCHIPVIAPDIGSISEIVINKNNGIILPNNFSIETIVKALTLKKFFQNIHTRDNAYQTYINSFNAKNNYKSFQNHVVDY